MATENKGTALITGASSGIGAVYADSLRDAAMTTHHRRPQALGRS